jgi:hypothetical protein
MRSGQQLHGLSDALLGRKRLKRPVDLLQSNLVGGFAAAAKPLSKTRSQGHMPHIVSKGTAAPKS